MKYLWVFVGFVAFIEKTRSQNSFSTGRSLYSSRYDNVNIQAILDSPRLVSNYVQCLLNRKPCPPEGKALKRILPEALFSKCGRCSPIQKENSLKVIKKLYNEYPGFYKELGEKYDPTGEYNSRYVDYLQGEQFNLINSNDQQYLSGGGGNSVEPNYQVISNNVIPLNDNRRRTTTTTTTRRPRTTTRITTTTTTYITPTYTTPTQTPTITTTKRSKRTKRPKTPKVTIPTTQSTPTVRISANVQTQRGTRSPTIQTGNNNNNVQNLLPSQQTSTKIQTSSVNIENRFGDDDEPDEMTTKSPFLHPDDIINSFFIPPTYEPTQHRPFVGLINTIGDKIQTIAGMLRTTVHVIVGN